MLVINPRDKTISCSRVEAMPRATATAEDDIEKWLTDNRTIEDLGETADGRGLAFSGRGLGIVRTEIYLDPLRKLPTKIVYYYSQDQTSAYTSAVLRYRWTDAERVDPSLLDPEVYVKTEEGRCRVTPAYQAYRLVDETTAANQNRD
jgi:hypothetical protein